MPASPFDILKSLQQPKMLPGRGPVLQAPNMEDDFGMESNAPAELFNFQNSYRDETRDRLRAAEGTNDPLSIRRLTGLLSDREDDIADSPITQQQGQYDERMNALRSSLGKGFGGVNPTGEEAEYARGVEQQKINAPIEQQRISGNAQIQEQRIASQGLRDVAETNVRGKTEGYDLLNGLLQSGAIQPGSRMSISGVGSVGSSATRRPSVSASTLKSLQDAHAQWRQAEQNDKNNWMPDFLQRNQAPARKAAYDSAVGAVFGSFPAHPEIKKLAGMIVADPDLATLDADTALVHPKVLQEFDLDGMDDVDYQQLTDLLLFARGLPQGQQ